LNIIDQAIDLPSEEVSVSYPVSYCALIGASPEQHCLHYKGSLWTRLEYELVDAKRVCPGIHKIRV